MSSPDVRLWLPASVVFCETISTCVGQVGQNSHPGPRGHGVVIARKTQQTFLDEWVRLSGNLSSCRNSGWVGLEGKSPSRGFLHSGVTLPPLAATFFSLRQVLRLGLRIADSFGQHLAQLGLRLRSLAREGFLPLGHVLYMGMAGGELNPHRTTALFLFGLRGFPS